MSHDIDNDEQYGYPLGHSFIDPLWFYLIKPYHSRVISGYILPRPFVIEIKCDLPSVEDIDRLLRKDDK
jgi:hypothetical protein